MMRPFFVIQEKGDSAKVAYFGEDGTKAQEVFNKLTSDETVDSIQLFFTPIPTSTFNPKSFAALAKIELAAKEAEEKRAVETRIQEAQAKLEKGQALVREAQEVLAAQAADSTKKPAE